MQIISQIGPVVLEKSRFLLYMGMAANFKFRVIAILAVFRSRNAWMLPIKFGSNRFSSFGEENRLKVLMDEGRQTDDGRTTDRLPIL